MPPIYFLKAVHDHSVDEALELVTVEWIQCKYQLQSVISQLGASPVICCALFSDCLINVRQPDTMIHHPLILHLLRIVQIINICLEPFLCLQHTKHLGTLPGCVVHDEVDEVINGMNNEGDNTETDTGGCPLP